MSNFANLATTWTSKGNLNFTDWNPYPELSNPKDCWAQAGMAYQTQFPRENYMDMPYRNLSQTYTPPNSFLPVMAKKC